MRKYLLVIISIVALGGSGICQPPPIISVNVLSNNSTQTDADNPLVVGNRKRIEVEVVCQSTVPSILKVFGYSAINPTAKSANDLKFVVIDTESGEHLRVKTSIMGSERRLDRRSIFVSFQIPENDSTRRAKLQGAINRAERDEPVSRNGVEDINKNRELILSALNAQYVENRQGHFLFSVLYHCSEPDVWNGSVSSTALTIIVNVDGTAGDALGAKE